MKLIILILILTCITGALYGKYAYEGMQIKIDRLESQISGYEMENEQISLKLLECQIGGFPHKKVDNHLQK